MSKRNRNQPARAAGRPGPAGPEARERAKRPRERAARRRLHLREQVEGLIMTLLLVLFGTTFSLQAFEIPSGSMEDTLLIGERVLTDKTAWAPHGSGFSLLPYREPRFGDIVVFKYPLDPSQHWVKRVIGAPGDRLRLAQGQLQLNGRFIAEPYVVRKSGTFDAYRDDFPAVSPAAAGLSLHPAWQAALPRHVKNGELVVPPGQYFVMGDNRDNSLDSRYWGFVPRENIVGKPLFVFWSFASTSQDFQFNSQWEWAGGYLKRIALFPFRARWGRMFLPAH